MRLQGAGAPGTVDATVDVRFADADGGTQISYDADAVVGGMVGGVGQRMLTSVSQRMAPEFFGNVEAAIAGGPGRRARARGGARPERAPAEAGPGVFTAPRPAAGRPRGTTSSRASPSAPVSSCSACAGGLVGRRDRRASRGRRR